MGIENGAAESFGWFGDGIWRLSGLFVTVEYKLGRRDCPKNESRAASFNLTDFSVEEEQLLMEVF